MVLVRLLVTGGLLVVEFLGSQVMCGFLVTLGVGTTKPCVV